MPLPRMNGGPYFLMSSLSSHVNILITLPFPVSILSCLIMYTEGEDIGFHVFCCTLWTALLYA